MTAEEYLKKVLEEQELSDEQLVALDDCKMEIEAFIREEFADAPLIKEAGSRAKGTMVKDSYDLDIVSYFSNEYDATIKEIYDDVADKLSKKYTVERKTSALRIKVPGNDDNLFDTHVDVVPGKFSNNDNKDAYININNGSKQYQKTNLKVHIEHIKGSGRQSEIRLIKLWNARNNIGVRTFILELLVVEILKNFDKKKSIDEQIKHVFKQIKENIDEISIEDPANPNGNDLSEIFNETVKNRLKFQATVAMANIENNNWEAVFGNVTEKALVYVDPFGAVIPTIKIGEFSHRKTLKAANLEYGIKSLVSISASQHWGTKDTSLVNRRFQKYIASGDEVPTYSWIKYAVNVGDDYDIFWQIVNTGKHARAVNNLRGGFIKGSQIHWETSLYTGKHWIQCFIAKDGICIAKSKPFFVVFKNPQFPYGSEN